MTEHYAGGLSTRFDEPGTIPEPGPIGRALRLGWGILIAAAVWSAIDLRDEFLGPGVPHGGWWIGIAIALMVAPYVINIGWGRNWRGIPRLVVIVVIVAGTIVSQLIAGTWWSAPLGWVVLAWYVYTLSHLGISFILAAVLATPGCEMRAIPHLWTKVTGRPTWEHVCPGHISRIDAWERGRRDARHGQL